MSLTHLVGIFEFLTNSYKNNCFPDYFHKYKIIMSWG